MPYHVDWGETMADNGRRSLLLSLAEIIKDYKHLPVRGEGDIPRHIERWLNQFDKKDQYVILYEMNHVMKKFYFSRSKVKEIIRRFILRIVAEGQNHAIMENVSFLSLQAENSSQRAILELVDETLREDFGYSLADIGTKSIKKYIYLDDAIYTGNRLRYDLTSGWFSTIVEECELIVYAIARHEEGTKYALPHIMRAVQDFKITFRGSTFLKINDTHASNVCSEILWPERVSKDELIDAYVSELCENATYKVTPERLFRPVSVGNIQETLFSSPEARRVVEQAFLRKGIQIIRACRSVAPSIRPLGFTPLTSLGFGTLFVTYRNIANNCPLVLWWGDADQRYVNHPFSIWYPLFPRVTNQVRDML